MTNHRPLSDWIALMDEGRPGPINMGAERTDARWLPMFTGQDWLRQAVVIDDLSGPVRLALGLINPRTGVKVAELDDYGRPLDVSEPGAELIREIEAVWPRAELSQADGAALASLSKEIRYFLFYRWEAEGSPSDELFHALPWEPVGKAADTLVELLRGNKVTDSVDLRHWVTPAILGVTGPMGQMYLGLVEHEPRLVRLAATALCQGLDQPRTGRVPASTASRLAALVSVLVDRDPFLRHTGRLARGRLTGEPVNRFGMGLDSRLGKAAAGQKNRFHEERREDEDQFKVGVRVSEGEKVAVTVEFAMPTGPDRDRALNDYGTLFQPVVVSSRSQEAVRYWIALGERRRDLSGSIELRAPAGKFHVDTDRAPVGTEELSTVDVSEVHRSILAASPAGLRVWRASTERLPASHPVHLAVRQYDSEAGRRDRH